MSIPPTLNGSLNGHGAGSLFDMRRHFARNLRIYYLFYGATGFLIWMPIWMIYLIDGRGMSITQVAAMESIFWVTIVIAEVPTGAIADRWGRRVSLCLGGCGFTIASIFFAFSSSYEMLAVCYAIMALAMTLHSGAGHALLFDTLRQLGRTNEYEKHVGRSEALSFAAMVAAMLLGGPLAALVGFSNTILIGVAPMAASAAIALLLREPPRREAEIAFQTAGLNGQASLNGQNGLGGQPPAAASTARSVIGNMWVGWLTVWRRKSLLAIILFATCMVVFIEMPDFFIQPFVREQGIDPREAVDTGLLYSVLIIPPIAGLVVGSLLAAGVAGRFGERRALPIVLLAAVLLFVPLALWNSLWVIAAIGSLAVLHGMIGPIATGYINRRIPSDQRATVLSIYELFTGLLMAGCVTSIGVVVDGFSFQAAFTVCLAALLVIGGCLAVFWRRSHAREQARSGIALSSAPAPQATTSPARSSAIASAVKPNDASNSSLS